MRPVVVCQSQVYGGGEGYLNRLYSMLAARGHQPVLVGQVPGWDEEGLARVHVPLSPKWSSRGMIVGALRLPRERRRLRRAIRDVQTDAFHVQYKREQVGFTRTLARDAPVVWTEHGRFLRGWKGAVLGVGYRAAARHAAVIVCVSDEVAADVRRVVGPGPRVEVIENGVDTVAFRPPTPAEKAAAKARLGIAADAPVLLWVGRLDASKRPDLAVDLAARWPGAAVIAGDGSLYPEVSERASALSNSQVLGFVEDVSQLYRAADVMAFTSTGAGEGYPTTLVEAGAHGVPVVGEETSGAARVLREMGGDPLPHGSDVDRWVEALLLSSTPERSLEVRRWAEGHDVTRWVRAHESVLASVVAGALSRGPSAGARTAPPRGGPPA